MAARKPDPGHSQGPVRLDDLDLVRLLARRTRRIALWTALGLALSLGVMAWINTQAQSRQNAELIRLSAIAAQPGPQEITSPAMAAQLARVERQVLQESERRALLGEVSENIQMALVAFGAFAIFVSVLLWLQRRWIAQALSPLHSMVKDMQAFEEGDLSRRTPAMALQELDILAKGFNHLAESLQNAIEAQQTLSTQSRDLRREERTRLARDLHDDLGQTLTAAAIEIEAARARGVAVEALAPIETSLHMARQRLRTLLASLRDEWVLEATVTWAQTINPWQLRYPQVQWMCSEGFATAFDALAPSQARVVHRIVQEGLVNAFRHASPSWVRLALDAAATAAHAPGPWMQLTIINDGVGLSPASNTQGHGFGLAGMRERIALIGGRLDAGGIDPAQWQLRCQWPIAPLHLQASA